MDFHGARFCVLKGEFSPVIVPNQMRFSQKLAVQLYEIYKNPKNLPLKV